MKLYRVYVIRDAFGEVPWSDSGTGHVPELPHQLVGSFASLARVVETLEELDACQKDLDASAPRAYLLG